MFKERIIYYMTISDYNRRDRYWQYHELAKRVEKPT